MKLGFAKNDITPRVGVELAGFGPYCCRHSIAVRDRLWARAMAVEVGGARAVLVTCDLIGAVLPITRRARAFVTAATGLPPDALMIASSHTHSGPNAAPYIGWGAPDEPYLETLPQRIARAAIAALGALEEATLSHAEVPCLGIGTNREYDNPPPGLAEALNEDWRPRHPELTDTTCHVLRAEAGGRLLGFVSYFGCHLVCCCAATRYIHGDYAGVATNVLEREHAGAVGLFLQGAQGDVNTCVVHQPEPESLLALDVLAGRYARAVRAGLSAARPLAVERLGVCRRDVTFSRVAWGVDQLRAKLTEHEALLRHLDATDAYAVERNSVRSEMVWVASLRGLLARAERGGSLTPPTEVHGLRLGPVGIYGSGFETFQAIKNDVRAQARAGIPLVCSFVDDSVGYAPDRTAAKRGGYAADFVPLMCGELPYAAIHDELVRALLDLDQALF